MENKLYYGDNLKILREYINDNSIDLIYLDPPFKSGKDYNILFKESNGSSSEAQIKAFEDTWHWNKTSEDTFIELSNIAPPKLIDFMSSFRKFLGENDMMAYLTMMSIRLLELKRVLKDTGSLYLHCDPTASHYLKILLDSIFTPKNFRNEIVWHYRKWPSGNRQFQRNHDCILFYSKTDCNERVFNQIDLMERTESTLKRFGNSKIVSGYDKNGIRVPSQVISEKSPGVPRDDVWDIGRVPPIKQLFPTQKPENLLSRIIRASSNENDLILDPFCGCGTTIDVAIELKRKWIGIDITHLAVALIKYRIEDRYGKSIKYKVIGEPEDLNGAYELAKNDRFQFQWWALSLVKARPISEDRKKGADKGIDGVKYFIDDLTKKEIKKIIIQVKSGHVGVKDIRELITVTNNSEAKFGVLITLENPTEPMKKEAITAGYYFCEMRNQNYPKIQILTIEELFKDKNIEFFNIEEPTYKKADKYIDKLFT
jgi:site-specific DNA-methyltransferase (adenine-specific)